MAIEIISNGSKWNGEQPDGIEILVNMLLTKALDPRFEEMGNFYYYCEMSKKFWLFGNFWEVSHVFKMSSEKPSDFAGLVKLIRSNQETDAYKKAKAEYNK